MNEAKHRGRVTIPTDVDVVPETLEILERWVSLNEETGEQVFRQIVSQLKHESTTSLEEFKRKQKK